MMTDVQRAILAESDRRCRWERERLEAWGRREGQSEFYEDLDVRHSGMIRYRRGTGDGEISNGAKWIPLDEVFGAETAAGMAILAVANFEKRDNPPNAVGRALWWEDVDEADTVKGTVTPPGVQSRSF